LIPNTVFDYKTFTFSCHVINYSKIRANATSLAVRLLSQILSTRRMSRSQVTCRRRVIGFVIKTFYYTITLSFEYPGKVSANLFTQVQHEFRRLGEWTYRKTVNRQFTRPHALGIPLGLMISHVETNCIIQDHHKSDSSQIFSGCSFRCTCLLQAAHLFGPIILQHICCCLEPFLTTCVEYTRLLHEIHLASIYCALVTPIPLF